MQVPAELRRLWGISASLRLGRPAELDVRRVVETAVELADRNGLAGVTLSKVAAALGFTSMSLYRYVGSKGELLRLMSNAALGTPPDTAHCRMAWRDALRHWAHALRERYLHRPWLARVPQSGPPSGPHEIAWLDTGLRALLGTGLEWGEKLNAVSVISGYVRHAAVQEQDLAAGRPEGQDQADAERDYGRALVRLVDPELFPEAAGLFASGLFETSPDAGEGPDDDFTFGLELILDGVATVISRATAP